MIGPWLRLGEIPPPSDIAGKESIWLIVVGALAAGARAFAVVVIRLLADRLIRELEKSPERAERLRAALPEHAPSESSSSSPKSPQ